MLRGAASRYDFLSRRWPLITQSFTAGLLGVVGDSTMQVAEGKQPFCDWDGLRTLRFSAFRCLVFSPLYVGWITLLERITLPRHSAVMAKTLLDSLVWTPTFHSIFYT